MCHTAFKQGKNPVDGRLDVDEILWCMQWSAALTPDLTMLPDRSVFLRSPAGHSLTATVEGMIGDIWEAWDYVGVGVDVSVSVNVDVDVDVVEGICCHIMQEPGRENRVSQDRVLSV